MPSEGGAQGGGDRSCQDIRLDLGDPTPQRAILHAQTLALPVALMLGTHSCHPLTALAFLTHLLSAIHKEDGLPALGVQRGAPASPSLWESAVTLSPPWSP